MAKDVAITTLNEAAKLLRECLALLDREQVGLDAACHIDLSLYRLEQEIKRVQDRDGNTAEASLR